MAEVNYYLKDKKSKEETLVFLNYYYNNRKFKFSTGIKISPKYWNFETQRIRKSSKGWEENNNLLNSLIVETNKVYKDAISNEIAITNDYLKCKLNKFLQKEDETTKKEFFEYLEDYIAIKKGSVSSSYIKKIVTLRNSLKNFEKSKRNFKLSFEGIDLSFHEQFTKYLRNERSVSIGKTTYKKNGVEVEKTGQKITLSGMLNNSIGSNFSVLRTFLIWATKRGYNTNLTFRDSEFKILKEDSDIVYLTEIELMNLFELDLTNNKRLEIIRDYFCFSCFTGLRYSDLSKVRKNSIKDDELTIVAEKTGEKIIVPLNEYAIEILKKYDYTLRVISNQKTNDNLKDLGELAGIDDKILIVKFRGKERIETEKPKHEFISTHTGRRTFIILSLEKGMRAETVMAITGHKDYRTFKKYIKITDKIKRIEMNMAWKREPKLKVVG